MGFLWDFLVFILLEIEIEKKLASLLNLSLLKSEAFSPLLDGDVSVVVGITSLEEWLDAGLHWDDWSGDWDEFVVGDGLVMWLGVELAELPDDWVDVLLLIIILGLREEFLPFEFVELTSLLQLLHDLEQPISHTFWELSHMLFGTLIKLLALSEILQMDLGIGGLDALLTLSLAETSLTVQVAEGGEGLVVVGADLVHRISVEFWALGNALTGWLSLLSDDAFFSPSALVILAWVLGWFYTLLLLIGINVVEKLSELIIGNLLLLSVNKRRSC